MSFKIATHFPLWLETNCCNHRIQNEREARHKNAGSNSPGCYINRTILSICEPMLKTCCIPNHTLFFLRWAEAASCFSFSPQMSKNKLFQPDAIFVHILVQLQFSRCLVLIIYSCDRKCGLGSWKNIKANSITPFHGAFPQMLTWFLLYWNLIVRKLCQEY